MLVKDAIKMLQERDPNETININIVYKDDIADYSTVEPVLKESPITNAEINTVLNNLDEFDLNEGGVNWETVSCELDRIIDERKGRRTK